MSVVRAAITQTDWTGDKESMIARHEQFARDAAAQGARIICFQELFYGPYFGIIEDPKYYAYAESIPGPTVERGGMVEREDDAGPNGSLPALGWGRLGKSPHLFTG